MKSNCSNALKTIWRKLAGAPAADVTGVTEQASGQGVALQSNTNTKRNSQEIPSSLREPHTAYPDTFFEIPGNPGKRSRWVHRSCAAALDANRSSRCPAFNGPEICGLRVVQALRFR